MPNKRAEGQKLFTVPASQDFIDKIDENLAAVGYSNRSQFIRDAILEKMFLAGIKLPKELSLSPDRVGKGGPNSKPTVDGVRSAILKRAASKIHHSKS